MGEIFICNEQTDGKLQSSKQFLGQAITGFGGGFDKLFVIEEGEGFEGRVSCLHKMKPVDPEQKLSTARTGASGKEQIHHTTSQLESSPNPQ